MVKTAAARIDPRRCEAIWKSALALYVADCRAALHDEKQTRGDSEAEQDALADLLTDQVQLAHLCDALGLDAEYVADRILRHID